MGHLSLAYRPKVSDRLFYEAGYSEELSYLVLTKASSHFRLCTACSVWTAYCQQARALFCPVLTFATKKVNSIWNIFIANHLLWSRLVLPGANMSHFYKKKKIEPMLLKHLKCHSVDLGSVWRPPVYLKYNLCLTLKAYLTWLQVEIYSRWLTTNLNFFIILSSL